MTRIYMKCFTGIKYENDTAEAHAETTKKINAMLKIEKTARKLTNEEVKAIWDEIESMVAPEDFLPVEYDKKGNAFPVYIIKKI